MTRQPRRKSASTWHIFRWPLLIAIVSLVGLLSALIGDNGFDVLSWCCLAPILLFMAYAYYGKRQEQT